MMDDEIKGEHSAGEAATNNTASEAPQSETPFRPLTRVERRNLWLMSDECYCHFVYYMALVPPQDQPEIGPEGLPVVFRYIHMNDVTIMSAGHKIKVPYWRGKIGEVDAFVVGATAGE